MYRQSTNKEQTEYSQRTDKVQTEYKEQTKYKQRTDGVQSTDRILVNLLVFLTKRKWA